MDLDDFDDDRWIFTNCLMTLHLVACHVKYWTSLLGGIGTRKRSPSCKTCGGATGLGWFLHSSYLYWTDSTGKACKWSHGMKSSYTLIYLYSILCHDRIILQALPDDLKSKLSLDEDLVSSPKEALSRASADRVSLRNRNLKRLDFCGSSVL